MTLVLAAKQSATFNDMAKIPAAPIDVVVQPATKPLLLTLNPLLFPTKNVNSFINFWKNASLLRPSQGSPIPLS